MSIADDDHGHRKEKGRKAKVSEGKVKMESCVCGWVGSGQTWWIEGKGVKKCKNTDRNPSWDQKDKPESARRLIKDEQEMRVKTVRRMVMHLQQCGGVARPGAAGLCFNF